MIHRTWLAFVRELRCTCTSFAISLAPPTPPRVRPALLGTRGRIDPSFIVSFIFGLGPGLRWEFTGRGFGPRLGGKDGSNTSSLDTHSSYSHSARVLHGPAVRSLALPHRLYRPCPLIHLDHDSDHMETTTSPTDFADVPAIDSERTDRPSWAGDAAGVHVRYSNSPGSTAQYFAPPLPGLDVARRLPHSLVNPLRCLLVCKYTRRIRMCVLATHIKHAMSRKIEWAALPALVYLCARASAIVHLRLPAHPVRNVLRSMPPISGPLQDHASVSLYPSLALVQTLPTRRGSRVPHDWALREVREDRRVPPPPPVMSHAWMRSLAKVPLEPLCAT